MSIQVRAATSADGAGIAAVQLTTWRATYGEWLAGHVEALDLARTADNWSVAAAARTGRVAVAVLDDRIVGYAHSGPPEDPPDTADHELYALYVLPQTQGAGAGSALVADAFAHAARGTWVVWALEAYAPARRFYERHGFQLDLDRTHLWRGLTQVRYVAAAPPAG